MPFTTSTHTEHLALYGPLGVSVTVVMGIALVALFAWSLWQERRILGPRKTLLFWLLRTGALTTVLWMLLAPAKVRVETSTTRRAVALATDISGSMRTIDPPSVADDGRWAMSQPGADVDAPAHSADRAVAALGVARRQLHKATEALANHELEHVIVESTSSAQHALERTRQHVQVVHDDTRRPGQAQTLAERILSTLDSSEFAAFKQLCSALSRGRTPAQQGWRESLPDLMHRVSALAGPVEQLARLTATEAGEMLRQTDPARLSSLHGDSRLGRVAAAVESLAPAIEKVRRQQADVQFSGFDRSVNPLPGPSAVASLRALLARSPDDTASAATNVSAVLEQLQRERQEQPLAAVFLWSDLGHNLPTAAHPREAAQALADVPVYVVPIGNPEHVRDVVLQSVHAPAVAMRNDDIIVEARIQAYDCAGEACSVQLLQEGRVVDFRELEFESSFANRAVRFEQQVPAVGTQSFQIAIAPLDGELTAENNYKDFQVNVTRSDIKLLLADELPRWEYRYLAQLFRRDPKIECDELLFHPRIIATGRRAPTQAFPVTVDEWDQYDLVLLGDLPVEHLPVASQESLVEYLKQRGGTVVLIAGQEAMPHAYAEHPLADVLPVEPVDASLTAAGPLAFRVTEQGSEHLALMIGETDEATRDAWDFVNRFSPLHAVSPWRKPKASAETLIAAVPHDSLDERQAARSSAFLCWQPVGRGRIVYLAGPDTYRLRLLRGDRLHYRFWGQLLRWAIASDLSTGGEFVRLRTDRSRYETRDVVHATVRLTDAEGEPLVANDLSVRVTSGENQRLAPLEAVKGIPGEYRAEIRSLPPGVYRIEAAGAAIESLGQKADGESASASFTVYADVPQELVDTRCNLALADHIAQLTGGQVLPPTAIEEVLTLTNLEPLVSERIETRPLWLEWKYLWIVFGCLQIEWGIRKWLGLS